MKKLSDLRGPHIKPIEEVPIRPTVTLDVWGGEQVGKSHFALTADVPGGTFYQTTEAASLNGVLQKFGKRDIVVAEYDSEIPPDVDRENGNAVSKYFKAELARFKSDLKMALDYGASVVVWDKAVQVWEIIRMVHFGRLMKVPGHLYGPPNVEWADLVALPGRHGASLIMINEEADEWVTRIDGQGKETRTTSGKKVRKGQDRTGYLVDASLRFTKTPPVKNKKGEIVTPLKFSVEFSECRRYPELVGSLIDGTDFATVKAMLAPETV